MISAFNSTKEALSKATMLAHPCTEAPIAVTVDASGVAVGAVLEQLVHGSWQPLAFFSRQLRPTERKYSAFDRELLALHLAVRHFRYFVEGRNFTAFTDHKPLTFAFAKVSDPWSARHAQTAHCNIRSTPPASSTSQERAIQSRTHSHGLPSMPRTNWNQEWTSQLWLQLNETTRKWQRIAQRSRAWYSRMSSLAQPRTHSCATSLQDYPRPIVPASLLQDSL